MCSQPWINERAKHRREGVSLSRQTKMRPSRPQADVITRPSDRRVVPAPPADAVVPPVDDARVGALGPLVAVPGVFSTVQTTAPGIAVVVVPGDRVAGAAQDVAVV